MSNTTDLPAWFDQPVNTSAKALAAIPLPKLKQLQDQIHDICLAAQRNGYDNLTRKEIQSRYELLYGRRIEASTVASRVNNLVAAGRLAEGPKRMCSVSETGNIVGTVFVPMKQVRMVA